MVAMFRKSSLLLMLVSSPIAFGLPNDTVSANCHNACKSLLSKFGPTAVHYYGHDNFTIWDAKQNEVQYACRFSPSNTGQVASAVHILTGNWCNFAVKSGGHSRDPDFSNSVLGVTIDLEHLNEINVAADETRARVGGGALTAEVYSSLDARNLSFVGGRVGGVGIGGFATGGGTSPLSSRHGWAVDNIYEYELVLPNATIVTVSENQHPDLYWALRGAGGANFGIITTFVVRTFPQGLVYAGQRTWNETHAEQALDEVYNLYTAGDDDLDMAFWYYYGYVQGTDSFTLGGTQRYYYPAESPSVFRAIDSIPAVSATQRNATMGSLAGAGRNTANVPVRHLFQTTTIFPSREWLHQSFEIFRDEVQDMKTVEGLNPQLITYPIPSQAIRNMKLRGGNALGLGDTQGPLFVTLLSLAWNLPEDDVIMGNFSTSVLDRLEATAKALGVYHPYKYIGYGRLGQDIFSSYGEENQQRLVRIQKEIDPKGIFTTGGLCHGGFKLR